MQVQYKTYDSYRDSKSEWAGEIPTHWETKKLRSLADFVNRGSTPDYVDESELKVVNQATFSKGYWDESSIRFTKPPKAELIRGRLEYNDILLASTGGGVLGKSTIFKNNKGNYIADSHVTIIRDSKKRFTPDFLHYCLAINFNFIEGTLGQGATNQTELQRNWLRNTIFPVPPRETQNEIVTFLDYKTADIDSAIRKKQRLIELLKEQKSIIINQAVTKGFNPNAAMKDSGVSWIGKIPDHWEVLANRYLFREANDRSKGGLETHLSMSQKLGLVPANQVEKSLASESYDGAKLVQINDLVLNRLKAHLSVFSSAYCSGLVSPDYSVFRLISPNNTVFYFENLFRTAEYLGEFNRRVKGIVVGFLRLYSDDFMSIPTIVPPANEQLEICARLKKINEEFAVVFNTTEKEIAKLNEFKQTLIAHAVTGKIKV